MSNSPVIIYSDSFEIEQSVQKLLIDLNMPAQVANTSDALVNLFKLNDVKILLLCFDIATDGIKKYSDIFNDIALIKQTSHRAISVCTEKQSSDVTRFCLEGEIDNFIIYYPVLDQASFQLIMEKSLSELKNNDEYLNCTSYLTALKQQSKILDKFVDHSFQDCQNLIDYSINSFSKLFEVFDKQLNEIIDEFKNMENRGDIIPLDQVTDRISQLQMDSLYSPMTNLKKTLFKSNAEWSDEKFKEYCRLSRKIHVPPSLVKSLSSRKILFVDDDELFRDIMVAMLEVEDYVVLTAAGSEQALETLKHTSPDVIVLDIDMPGINGLELLKIIRANEEWDEIPVLMLTGVVDESTLSTSIKAGANGFFAKPGSEIDGFETIDSLFRDDGPLQTRHKPTPTRLLMTEEQRQSLKPLIIDDDVFMLEIIGSLLENLDIQEWGSATGGKETLQLLDSTESHYNVLILDLNMPGMDGIELLRHLADRQYNGGIILISGYGSRLLKSVENLGSSHRLKLIGSLGKPITPLKLAEMLNKADCLQPGHPLQLKDQWLPSVDDIRNAIDTDEFILYYQPKLEIQTKTLAGVEALARWQHPELGIITAAQFIKTVEDNDLIHDFTKKLFRLALDQHMSWKEAGYEINISVNISAEILNDLEFPEFLTREVEIAGMQAKNITLEITETGLIKNHTSALDILNRLRLRGFKLSIDDFGTGDSSFKKLKQMPFDQLKIDREFIHGATNDKDARAIVDASVILSKELNLEVVAEGIENIEDWNFSLNAGCKIIQGYFMSRPIPPEEIIPWIKGLQSSRK